MSTATELTIEELEEQLRRKKVEPRVKQLMKMREQMLPLIGKCSATHSLNRDYIFHKNKSTKLSQTRSVQLRKVIDITIGQRYHSEEYTEEQLYSLHPDILAECCPQYKVEDMTMIMTSHDRKQLEVASIHHVDYLLRYAIPSELYDNLKNIFLQKMEDIFNMSAKKLRGQSELNSRWPEDSFDRLKTLEDSDYCLLELDNDESYTLSKFHPFLYGNKIICSDESINFIDKKIKYLYRIINNTRSFSYGAEYISAYELTERDRRDVEILEGVVKKIKEHILDKSKLSSTTA